MTCTCHPDHLDLGGWDKGCPVHDPGARAEATAARIAAEARANVAAGRDTFDAASAEVDGPTLDDLEPADVQTLERRYERWLDRIGGSA